MPTPRLRIGTVAENDFPFCLNAVCPGAQPENLGPVVKTAAWVSAPAGDAALFVAVHQIEYSVSGTRPVTSTVRFVRDVAVPAGTVKVSPPPVTTNQAWAAVAPSPGALRTAETVALSAPTDRTSGSPMKRKSSAIVVSPAQSSEIVADQPIASSSSM